MTEIQAKDKYTYIVALLAVVLAFGAFKEQLAKVHVPILFWEPSLLLLFVEFSIILTASAYFFALDYLRAGTRFEAIRILKTGRLLAHMLYALGVLMPAAVVILWLVTEFATYLASHLSINAKAPDGILLALNLLFGVLAGVTAAFTVVAYGRARQRLAQLQQLVELGNRKDAQLQKAEALYKQRFYTSSIIEAYKLVELALAESLQKIGYDYAGTMPAQQQLQLARKSGILMPKDEGLLRDLRGIRNKAAHKVVDFGKKDADFALEAARKLLVALSPASE